jgi:SAM-dependent methyltransferase
VFNPFVTDAVARRYARARPYYHRTALALAVEKLGIERARVAIDVGCGTGLSTLAVSGLADRVIAIDTSPAMLRTARRRPDVHYVVAAAERIPVRDAIADLATVGAAFHWFDQPRVFAELARVLRNGAGLAVYTDLFRGRILGLPTFTTWLTESYLPRYPTPPRGAHFDPAGAVSAGFTDVRYAEQEIHLPLTHAQLADYLLSQSNAAVAIESGATSAETIRNEVMQELADVHHGRGHVDAVFGIRVWSAVRRPQGTISS